MYPRVQLGPLGLSSSGMLLILGLLVGHWVAVRVAGGRGGLLLEAQVNGSFYPVVVQ